MVNKKTKELCHYCGASLMKNSYTMNKTLVNALGKMSKHPGKYAGEIPFTKSEYSVYTKLKFWGMISRLDDLDEGLWQITAHGKEFLRGKIKVPREIEYFRNEVVWMSDETTDIFNVFPSEESRRKYKDMMSSF